jgi:hypothetical protein
MGTRGTWCLGVTLGHFLSRIKLVSGFGDSPHKKLGTAASGPGDLTAQLLCHLKKAPGGVYCTAEDDEQDCNYTIFYITDQYGKSQIAYIRYHEPNRNGEFFTTVEDFVKWYEKEDE